MATTILNFVCFKKFMRDNMYGASEFTENVKHLQYNVCLMQLGFLISASRWFYTNARL